MTIEPVVKATNSFFIWTVISIIFGSISGALIYEMLNDSNIKHILAMIAFVTALQSLYLGVYAIGSFLHIITHNK